MAHPLPEHISEASRGLHLFQVAELAEKSTLLLPSTTKKSHELPLVAELPRLWSSTCAWSWRLHRHLTPNADASHRQQRRRTGTGTLWSGQTTMSCSYLFAWVTTRTCVSVLWLVSSPRHRPLICAFQLVHDNDLKVARDMGALCSVESGALKARTALHTMWFLQYHRNAATFALYSDDRSAIVQPSNSDRGTPTSSFPAPPFQLQSWPASFAALQESSHPVSAAVMLGARLGWSSSPCLCCLLPPPQSAFP